MFDNDSTVSLRSQQAGEEGESDAPPLEQLISNKSQKMRVIGRSSGPVPNFDIADILSVKLQTLIDTLSRRK